MEAQEIFDKVVNHLATQKVQSKQHICLYRGPGGIKCAFGIFIPDELFLPGLEGHTSAVLFACAHKKAGGGTNGPGGFHSELWEGMTPELIAALEPLQPHAVLLRELQQAHDTRQGTQDWAQRLTNIANSHGLKFDRPSFELQLSEPANK